MMDVTGGSLSVPDTDGSIGLWPLASIHVAGDSLIFVSCLAMVLAAVFFARRRHDLSVGRQVWIVAGFLIAWGGSNLVQALDPWWHFPVVGVVLHVATGLLALMAAISLWSLLPHALELPTPGRLKQVNDALQNEIDVRMRTEQDLRQSEALYRSLVVAMSEGISVQTADGTVVAVNPAAERIFGRTSDELLGRSSPALLDGAVNQNGDPFPAELLPPTPTLQTGEPQSDVVLGIRRPNGSLVWLSVNVQPLILPDANSPHAVITTFHDITERRHAGEELARYRHRYRQHLLDVVSERTAELQSSENRYGYLFRNMHEGLAHCRGVLAGDAPIDYEFVEVNPAFEKVTGLADVVGRTIGELLPEAMGDHAYCLERIDRVVQTGESAHWERYVAELKRWLSFTVYRPAVGEFVLMIQDISERQRALADLRESEDRLQLAKAAAGLGIFDWDVASGVGQCDDLAREFLGVSAGELISESLFIACVFPPDRPAVMALVAQAMRSCERHNFCAEFRVVNRVDGRMRQLEANGQAICENGRAVRLIGTVKDITAQKQLESEAQGRRGAMELLAKQQVAAQTAVAIAHELNQPLVAVSAYSEAALHILRGGIKRPEKLNHAMEGAMEQAQRAGQKLHELIAFLHKGELVLEPVDLNVVVAEALAFARDDGYGYFTPVVDLQPDLPPVMANRVQLQKVLVNLLRNGVEAMQEAGVPMAAITITVRTIAEHNVAQVTVQDNGPGLDAETIHRIFEPFFTTKPTGIGLGLAISRALVEAHGGQLWADLESGPGATFHFTIPFAK